MYQFNHSPISGHLGWFHFLIVTNSAAMTVEMIVVESVSALNKSCGMPIFSQTRQPGIALQSECIHLVSY